jgi:hypothetical protein
MAFETEHSSRSADDLDKDMTRLVDGALTYFHPTKGGVDLGEPWRKADRAELAEALAVHINAGIAPVLDRRVSECVTGTLTELQRPRDTYMRPLDPAEERWRFWVPDQAAQARAVELLAECANPGHLCAVIPMVQPGKEFEVWTHGQEVITVRPVVILASRSHESPGLPFAAARRRAFEIAYIALNGEPGTVAVAVVLPDGQFQVFECGPGGELGTREAQLEGR